ncbi:O-antigen translocase [Pseudidiomarina atlantica]|nr:O-antigen translocase [Pseudidiomarina atlantica]
MMQDSSNSRGLLRSMLIIGSAQSVNILLSILRLKILALLLGPAGIGLLGIFTNLQQIIVNGASLGMSSSGVRQIAANRKDIERRYLICRVLLSAHLIQGTVALVIVWLLREYIAIWFTGDNTYSTEIGIVGCSALFALLATAHTALLQGMREISMLGRVTVIGACASTFFGVVAVWYIGMNGLVWFLIIQAGTNLVVAVYYTTKLNRGNTYKLALNTKDAWAYWKPMARMGAAFMVGTLTTVGCVFLVRGFVTNELGLDAAGYFAASWGVSFTYVGFLLGAMGADYYPRLSEVIYNNETATRLINDQAQLSLAIGGPVLILLIGWAPWVISLLYASDFTPAVELLQWQTAGNIFKIASWSLSYAVIAGAHARVFVLIEVCFSLTFVAIVWLLLPSVGIEITGIGFLFGYIIYFAVSFLAVRKLISFKFQLLSYELIGYFSLLSFILLWVSTVSPTVSFYLAPLLSLISALFSIRVVLRKIESNGKLASKFFAFFKLIHWPIKDNKSF